MHLIRILTAAAALLISTQTLWATEPSAAPKPDDPKAETRAEAKARASTADVRSIIPNWTLGDRWTVETVNRRIQVRSGLGEAPIVEPIQWHFSVSRFEKTLEHDCIRIEITCDEAEGRQPRTVLWIDRESRALRRVTMEIPTLEGFRQINVHYQFDADQPSPVLGPLTALPIDMPAFVEEQSKGLEAFSYTTFHGDPEAKGLDQIGFAAEARQQIQVAAPEDVRALLRRSFEKSVNVDEFEKSLGDSPITDVRMTSGGQQTRQLWQSGQPWPLYSDNGLTVCRLVSVQRAKRESTEVVTPSDQP